MRIGLNGTAYDTLSSGARDRFVHLYPEVARRSPEDDFLVYSPKEVSLSALTKGGLPLQRSSPLSSSRPLRRFLESPDWFRQRLTEDRVDVFVTDHFPVSDVPGVETILTIHDLRYLVLPREGSLVRRLYFRHRYASVAARARAVVTVSETMKHEIVERLGLRRERVHVVANGVADGFERAGKRRVSRFCDARGLPRGYLLVVGVLERRKNLSLLLRAYARAGRDRLPPLVLSGRGGSEEPRLRRLAARFGIEDRVEIVGYTADDDLAALYSGAGALLMPSKYEGFGLPVLQAFACGTPVLCSRAGALPEVAGDGAVLLDPDDADAWAGAMVRILSDSELRSRVAKSGKERAAVYSWKGAAERFLDVLARLRPEASVPGRMLG